MKFKEPHMEAQFLSRPLRLLEVCKEFEDLSEAFGIEPVVTRVTDPVEGESGVHPAGRAVDFRDEHDGVLMYTDAQTAAIVEYLNKKFERGDGKPVCLHHSFQGGQYHWHLQTPIEWGKGDNHA